MLSSDSSQCMYSGGADSWLGSGINPGVYKARPCLPGCTISQSQPSTVNWKSQSESREETVSSRFFPLGGS